MEILEKHEEYVRYKLTQAMEHYEEAKGLLADDAGLGYVVNSLYYALYYPVLALLHTKDISPAMQSVSIALFEREFVDNGVIDRRFLRALQKAFVLKPKCSTTEIKTISRAEVKELFAEARDFLEAARERLFPCGVYDKAAAAI